MLPEKDCGSLTVVDRASVGTERRGTETSEMEKLKDPCGNTGASRLTSTTVSGTSDDAFKIGGTAMGGVAIGSALGSILSPAGAAVGGVVGGLFGAAISAAEVRKRVDE